GIVGKKTSRLMAFSALMMPVIGTLAMAEDDSGQAVIAEIIVTAQKRSENIQDVPISITAVTRDQLINAGVTDTSQLSKLVPGFTYQQSSYGTPVYTIRGIGFYDTSVGI